MKTEFDRTWVACDWGFTHPCALLFFTQLDREVVEVHAEGIFFQMLPAEVALMATEGATRPLFLERHYFHSPGPGESIGDQMKAVHPNTVGVSFARQRAWDYTQSRIEAGTLVILPQCPKLKHLLENTEEFPMHPFEGDDLLDALMIGMSPCFAESLKKPEEVKTA